jgi:hypothetical protein
MRGTIRSVVVSIPLVPLLVTELPTLLRLVFPQFPAITVHVSLALLVVVQAMPFGSSVLSVGVFTPIPGTAPAGTIGTLGASRTIVYRRWRIISRTVTANSDRKTSLRKRRASGDYH